VKDRYKFFGEVALEKRFVTAEQLYEALTIQARDKVDGKPERLLGQILLELAHIDEDQIRQVLDILYPVVDS
jgi:Ca2+-dependent lipid-binding protein